MEFIKQQFENKEGKLCSYNKFKTVYGLENDLKTMRSFEHQRNFTRLHISLQSNKLTEVNQYQSISRQKKTVPQMYILRLKM